MNVRGKGLLKAVSILFIIFGAIGILIPIIGLIGSAKDVSLYGGLANIIIVTLILIIVVGVFELILGIVGPKKYREPAEGKFFIIAGIILCALSLVSLIMGIAGIGFDFVILGIPVVVLTFISIVLSILCIIGGSTHKKLNLEKK